ncbi:MAG: hypothetical protein PVI86_04865 [Phycisphaerae bacterium]|jgi:hypothetical protein
MTDAASNTPLPPRKGLEEGDITPLPPREGLEEGDITPLPPREGLGEGKTHDALHACHRLAQPPRGNLPIGPHHRILSVIAPHSGSGKTLFVMHLLRSLKRLNCLKISPAHGSHADFPQYHVQGTQDYFFEAPNRLRRPGKDTALYLDAGARHVERLRHRGPGLAPGLADAFTRFSPDTPVVVESSSAVELMSPVAVVLVARPPVREMKPATERILHRVTDLLINTPCHTNGTNSEAYRLRETFPSLESAQVWSADLGSEPPPAELLERIARRLLLPEESCEND